MNKSILIIGGCRSGKSRHALNLADQTAANGKVFIATCQPLDEEMKDRVKNHQAERGEGWTTVEAPVDLPGVISKHGSDASVILADCLTLWVNNLLMESEDPDYFNQQVQSLIQAMTSAPCPVILVSNEVGCGIVPENRLARLYRDMVGKLNQTAAATADTVIWTAAGIPVTIKGI